MPSVASGNVLHVGCGGAPLPEWLTGVTETRVDIDPSCSPDIVASMTDLGDIGEFDTIYCSHSLEHLTKNGAVKALTEFYRVLAPGGKVIVTVPDLEGVEPTEEVLFVADSGPITGIDMIYGASWLIDERPFMKHQTGFTRDSLEAAMKLAGFDGGAVTRAGSYNLIGVGTKHD